MNVYERKIFKDMCGIFQSRKSCLIYTLPYNQENIKLLNNLLDWDYSLFPDDKERQKEYSTYIQYAEKHNALRIPFRFLYDYLWDKSYL
jgi:hypothetical protein